MKNIQYTIGGKKGKTFELEESKSMVAVRTKGKTIKNSLKSKTSKDLAGKMQVKEKIQHARVTVIQVKENEKNKLKVRNAVRKSFKKEKDLEFAGRVLVDTVSKEPVLYTENLFIEFKPGIDDAKARKIIADNKLQLKKKLEYADYSYFVSAADKGMKVFEIAKKMMKIPGVVTCEPELIRRKAKKDFQIYSRQWHLKKTIIDDIAINASAQVDKAHTITKGEGVTVAVIDPDGVDIRHKEFPGNKIVAPINVTSKKPNPVPKSRSLNHGTGCAGVACGAGADKACGVAPAAKLMPIRSLAGLGSNEEGDSVLWAINNGADIISNSWGYPDGDVADPNDPMHFQEIELQFPLRKAIEKAVKEGRNGKGCIVLFSAGNGNESADKDRYITNPNIIAVAACNDTGKKSVYSDFGKCVWVCFPSDDFEVEGINDNYRPLTPGIWTTDTAKKNKKRVYSKYMADFGGTSSACPGVAGVCALILSVNPDLSWQEVKDILKKTADKIDKKNGKYDSKGHSEWYGYGRVNAYKAVKLAKKMKK